MEIDKRRRIYSLWIMISCSCERAVLGVLEAYFRDKERAAREKFNTFLA